MARRSLDPQRLATLQQMEELKAKYGPAFLTGSGETGLGKHDAMGYSQMLNDQTEYQNLARSLEGQDPLNVEYGGTIQPKMVGSPFDAATGENNMDAFGLPSSVDNAALQGIRAASTKQKPLYDALMGTKYGRGM